MRVKQHTISEQRNYLIKTVEDAKMIALGWIEDISLEKVVKFGLPEIDDRYHIWRVPLCSKDNGNRLGEVVLNALTAEIIIKKTTKPSLLEVRLLQKDESKVLKKKKSVYSLSQLRNTIGLGDCEVLLKDMPAESIDLVFTSPPYFNARPEYSEYEEYDEYLKKMRSVIRLCHKVLADGRFFVMNTSPNTTAQLVFSNPFNNKYLCLIFSHGSTRIFTDKAKSKKIRVAPWQ